MHFSDLHIFENEKVNTICDRIFIEIHNVFGNTSHIMVCGSMAKVFHKLLPKDYQPKDLDFVITNYFVYRMLQNRLPKLFPDFSLEVKTNRIILFTGVVAMEFWKPLHTEKLKLYKNKIPYTL